MASKGYKAQDKRMRDNEEKYERGRPLEDVPAGAATQHLFGGKLLKPDYEADDRLELKRALVGKAAAGGTPLGQAMLTEEEMKILMDKKKRARYQELMRFSDHIFDLKDPYQARLAKEINPTLHNMRMQDLEERAELQKRLAKIKIRGYIDSWEDVELLYGIAMGDIDVPGGALYESQPTASAAGEARMKGRGIFNPRRNRSDVNDIEAGVAITDFLQQFPGFTKFKPNQVYGDVPLETVGNIKELLKRDGKYGRL